MSALIEWKKLKNNEEVKKRVSSSHLILINIYFIQMFHLAPGGISKSEIITFFRTRKGKLSSWMTQRQDDLVLIYMMIKPRVGEGEGTYLSMFEN